jgi:hypothetical protein
MVNILEKFKNFFKPDKSDYERVKRWEEEMRDPDKPQKSLTIEDFERAKKNKRNKNKTLSSNF